MQSTGMCTVHNPYAARIEDSRPRLMVAYVFRKNETTGVETDELPPCIEATGKVLPQHIRLATGQSQCGTAHILVQCCPRRPLQTEELGRISGVIAAKAIRSMEQAWILGYLDRSFARGAQDEGETAGLSAHYEAARAAQIRAG